jgi:ABC-type molybdate transport system substrate-binding protein
MRIWRILLVLAGLSWSMMARADEPVRVFAAGSLRAVLTELGAAYKAKTGTDVAFTFGASGLLRDRLASGEAADVFASANVEHPEALTRAGKTGAVRVFTRNELCALVSPKITVLPETLLKVMQDPAVKLGISTPKADPSGDYAMLVFDKAEALAGKAVADALRAKALQLTGGPNSPPPPANRSVYGELVAGGQADIFLTYCTNAVIAVKEHAALRSLTLQADIAVGADYGLTVMKGAGAMGEGFADFVLSTEAQRVFSRFGFRAKSK